MNAGRISIFKKAPFVHLLLPLVIGVVMEWYLRFSLSFIILSAICFIIAFITFKFLPDVLRYRLKVIQGLPLSLIILCLGMFITYQKDIRNDRHWFVNSYNDSDYLVIRVTEPLQLKTKSYKSEGVIEKIVRGDSSINCKGNVLLYFENDSLSGQLKYGDKVLFKRAPERIKNLGNPGEFNYAQFASLKQVYHTVYLRQADWIPLHQNDGNAFKKLIISARQRVLDILENNIPGKDEKAIAEAMLIGYKENLDKDIIQSYSNTGVIHIIIIAGLHLGIIYLLLSWLLKKISFFRRVKLFRLTLLLFCIWLFALLTGAGVPVLRATVMITCFIVGEAFEKRSYPINSLAASAFLLLCIDPYFVFDGGFQLSYLAVTGILIFQKPFYNLLYFENKLFDKIWKLMSVSLAAQLLTFPLCLYYFHQFPLLFLTSNLIAVPLMAIILYAEVLVILVSPFPFLAHYLGKITGFLIGLMNKAILFTSHLPFAIWKYIFATPLSTILLYAIIIAASIWLMNKNKLAFKFSLTLMAFFIILMGSNKWLASHQQRLIVYNVPQHKAIDVVSGYDYKFIGDSVFSDQSYLESFYLRPGRTSLRLDNSVNSLPSLIEKGNFLQINNKRVLFIDSSIAFVPMTNKIDLDMIIISKNPKLFIPQLDSVFNCRQYIFDASNTLWKIDNWKKDCERLHLPFHSVPEQGAFVMDL